MRFVGPVLAITAGIAHADSWSEFGAGEQPKPLSRMSETCEVEIQFRGAVVEAELRQHLTNPSTVALAATSELTLPADAKLVGLAVERGHMLESAVAVPEPVKSEPIVDEQVLGADPALVTHLTGDRYRVIVQPIRSESELTVVTRWTALADIHGGALHLDVPAGERCQGWVRAKPGPGASVAHVRIDGTVAGDHGTAPIVLGTSDTHIAVELAFKQAKPLVWTQSEADAQAITIIAPSPATLAAKRVLFVIDASRSMELIGHPKVKQVVTTLVKTLPAGTEIEAILFDRKPARVFGSWQPATRVGAIEQAIDAHPAGAGSDAAAALTVAHETIGDSAALVVLVTDGMLGEQAALPQMLARAVGVHVVVLSPGRMRNPSPDTVRSLALAYGGSYTEIAARDLDSALPRLDLRPAWFDVAGLDGLPAQLPAGSGVVRLRGGKALPKLALTARLDKPQALTAMPAGSAPIAELAGRRPAVDETHALVVLASTGKVAKSRRAVVAGGGPYTRMIGIAEPTFLPVIVQGTATVTGGSSLDRDALRLLLRTSLEPAAFACYQRALALHPKLGGVAAFKLEIGRGELMRASVGGLGEPTFDACLLDAAYLITPPLPNPDYNVDDRTIVNYPLTFTIREDKPLVVPGDADSSSPLDIEAIQGGPPKVIHAGDTSTPLGNLRPTKP